MLARMARELREVYREFADVSVDTGGVAPEEVRDRVLAAL
jgi:hypothetical protein